ncbi:Rv1355c family protein [Nakamurella deserti]|uniref:Rv1355c family protein n=1 Tax=Nakamurella deserti TaxID=2164074 RepID=UPI000DBE2D37|nr:Rv1355c family protein [Nakamurella deserti]
MSRRPLFARRPAPAGTDAHRAVVLDAADPSDATELRRLRRRRDVTVVDQRAGLAAELTEVRPPVADTTGGSTWAWYPWRRTLVAVPPESVFHLLRLDRNRNKITVAEQNRFRELRIGVVGLSVGHAIAYTLAQEGLCGGLRLADLDSIELSNLNRIPASLCDLGTNKAVAVARRVAELDPYLDTQVYLDGLTEECMDEFFDGLDLVIEECDSLDMKFRIREEARRRGVPVLMETSDRGLFDVERFDLDPQRPLFHGLLGEVSADTLRGLSTEDKAPHVMRILQTGDLSARMAASMVEIDRTVSTWPQLAGDVQLGGATVAAAVRRFGRGQHLPSGRVRVDLDRTLAALDTSDCAVPRATAPDVDARAADAAVDLTAVDPGPADAVVHAVRLAPSGGNIQPWTLTPTPDGGVDIHLDPARTSALDVAFRGSYVAIGAAAFNATVAAARHGRKATVTAFPAGPASGPVVSVALSPGTDPELAALYPAMVRRITDRAYGRVRPLEPAVAAALQAPVAAVGARLHLVTDRARVARLADLVAASDRIRFLTPLLHREMMGEMRWPASLHAADGIDVATLGMDAADLAKLEVAARADVMAELASWGGGVGAALGDNSRDRINSSSAIAVLTVDAARPADYVRGGMALEHLWIRAGQHGLGVHPVSPVFLYAHDDADRRGLSETFADELGDLQQQFGTTVGLAPSETPVLVLRLSHDTPPPAARSRRLDRDVVLPQFPAVSQTSDPTNGRKS